MAVKVAEFSKQQIAVLLKQVHCILINTVDLEDMLGEIETYCRGLHRSGSPPGAEAITLSHTALPGAGAVHPIIYGAGSWNQERHVVAATRDRLY